MKALYEKAKNKASEVLRENFIVAPPVRVDEIAKNYNIGIFEVAFPAELNKVAGFIDIKKRSIYVNKDDSSNRKTFTIAHELGHLLLHETKLNEDPKYAVLYRIPLGQSLKDPIEQEANCFAANLLVPANFLKQYKDLDINEIAEIFAVSAEVIGYRQNAERKC